MAKEMLKMIEEWKGWQRTRTADVKDSEVDAMLSLLMNEGRMPAHQHEFLMREVITTSRFPYIFGYTIDRELLARYKAVTADWKSYFRVKTTPNFNTFERHEVEGNDNRLGAVDQKGEYLVTPASSNRYTGSVKKYGRQFDISWESTINDMMGAFSDIPQRFADACIRTEAYLATGTYASATGPNASLFATAVTNAGVLALTIANLETTLALMAAQTDANGEPIGIRGAHLVVPPALEYTARAILTSALKQWTEVGAGGGIPVPTANIVPQLGIKLHVDPYLPIVDTSANNDGTWYVFADPSEGASLEADYLRGYETPEICMKASDKVLTAGGDADPFSGDFATDNVFFRVRMVFGTLQLNPRYAYAQVHA